MAGNQRAPQVIVDDRAFQDGLRRAVASLKLDTEADLIRLGHRAVRAMRQFCPVDTGRLRNSIGMTQGRDGRGLFIDVGTNLDYAPPVEFGTRHQEPQPFVRRGLEQTVQGGLR